MKKNLVVCIVLIAAVLLVTGNTLKVDSKMSAKALTKADYTSIYSTKTKLSEEDMVEQLFLNALEDFSFKSCSEVFEENNKNYLYSPVSLYYALSIAASGASGSTEEEILKVLEVKDSEELVLQCGSLYRQLYRNNKYADLRIANSLWLDKSVDGQPVNYSGDYLKKASDSYYASVYETDFSDERTGRDIGQWIKENTDDTLGENYEVDRNQVMSIINTVYFKSPWKDKFSKRATREDKFYLDDGDTVNCQFMNKGNCSGILYQGDGFSRGSLRLKNGTMEFILPDKGIKVGDIISSTDRLKEAFTGGEGMNGDITWKIPKFTNNDSNDLVKALKSMGIKTAFSETADFSGIADVPLFISKINQNTYVNVDEEGAEASAFTEIGVKATAVMGETMEMILDRPFIYGIRSEEGVLLFIGVCYNPCN